jgi:hypothetical protein
MMDERMNLGWFAWMNLGWFAGMKNVWINVMHLDDYKI